MNTTIDNNQRIFLILGDMNRHVVRNLADLPKGIQSFDDQDSIKISHLWNNKFRHASKKMINQMFIGSNMTARIK